MTPSALFDERSKEAVEWLGKEFSGIRTGRATPALVDSIQVESYGARVPLNQVSSISVEDARTLRIAPWDAGLVKVIEKALTDANLGVSVASDDRGVRVGFPELTGERRASLIKLARAKLEEARVSVRQARDEAMKELDRKEKAGELGSDETFRAKEELQKHVDAVGAQCNEMLAKKEREINQ